MARAREPEPPAEGQGEGSQDGTLDDRVGKLEAGQNELTDKLDQVIGMLGGKGDGGHADDPTVTAEPGGNPAGIAHEIRAQLDERDRKAKAQQADSDRDTTLADLQAKVAELTEKPPDPLPRRVEKIMGWN